MLEYASRYTKPFKQCLIEIICDVSCAESVPDFPFFSCIPSVALKLVYISECFCETIAPL